MIVRCLRIIDAQGNEFPSWDQFAVGDSLLVVEITLLTGEHPTFRVANPEEPPDDRLPTLWPATMFEVTDPSIPSSWEVESRTVDSAVHVRLGPARWLRPGFWEDIADGSERTTEAIVDYDRELALMLAEAELS